MAWEFFAPPVSNLHSPIRSSAINGQFAIVNFNSRTIYHTADFSSFVTETVATSGNFPLDACFVGSKWQVVTETSRLQKNAFGVWAAITTDMYPGFAPTAGARGIGVIGSTIIATTGFFHVTRSADSGATWTIEHQFAGSTSPDVGDSTLDYSRVYVIGTTFVVAMPKEFIAVSTDDGLTWGEYSIGAGFKPRGIGACAGGWIAVHDTAGVPRISTDNGQTWSDSSLPSDVYRVVSVPSLGVVALARLNSGSPTVSTSSDLATWTARDMTGVTATRFDSLGELGSLLVMHVGGADGDGIADASDGFYTTDLSVPDVPPPPPLHWSEELNPLLVRDFYTLTISADGFADIEVPISSWQATANEGALASYVQAVVPAVTDWIDQISERQAGELIISMGYVDLDGTSQSEEVIRSAFTDFRIDTGPTRSTGTLSGSSVLNVSEVGTEKTLRGVRLISVQGGLRRATCSIDMTLKPGMTVTAEGEEFVVSYINYFANATERFMQVGER